MAERQSSMPLFDRPASVPFRDPSLSDAEKVRLTPQALKIAAVLREGPATNLELGMISQRFGARLHDLKRAGFHWSKTTVKAGVYRYEMVRDFLPEQR